MIPDYDPAQQRGDSLSESWRDPNKPKLKNIKDEDVAYELRELSKYTSLTPEIINIICHGYARICQLERERDEARREVCEWVEMDGATTAKEEAELRGWDCFKNAPVVKTLNGIVVSKAKAVPPKFELGDDDK